MNEGAELRRRRLDTHERALVYIRDALSFYITSVRSRSNTYNLTIIIVSMGTAFFETLKTEFGWGDASKSWLNSLSTILPIGMTSFIAFISTLMKFERITDKMEDTTKSIEKCHYAINRQREIRDIIDTSSPTAECCSENQTVQLMQEASLCFREAIMNSEMLWLSRMDPSTKRLFLKRSDHIHSIFTNQSNDPDIISLIEQSFKADTPKPYWLKKYVWKENRTIELDTKNDVTTIYKKEVDKKNNLQPIIIKSNL